MLSDHLGDAQIEPVVHQRSLCPTAQPDEDIIRSEIALIDTVELEWDVMQQISQQEYELILRGASFYAQVNESMRAR